MLEISIFCVILFAIAYWATLFIMGRRVLHGEFVEAEPELADAAVPASAPMPVFPPKPVIKPGNVPKPAPLAVTAPQPAPPAVVAAATEKPANAEALQSLLVSLKQELKNAAQI
jgi:hypothetical protein